MGQQDVKKVLKKEGTWLISNEIAKKAGYSLKSIQSSLRRLVKWGQIEKKPASKVIGDKKRLKDRSFSGYAYKLKEYRTISDKNFSNKKVLLLTDLNSIKTIKELYLQPKIKLVILPHTEKKDLAEYSEVLSNKLNKKVTFIENPTSKETQEKLKNLKPQQIILFDNIKNLKEEKKESSPKSHSKSKLVKTLSPFFDLFVNDSFSTASKSYASTVGFSFILPTFMGRNFEKNLESLQEFKNIKQKITFILGGKNSQQLIKFIEKNNKKQNTFLTTGLFSHLCLKELGVNLGNPNKLLKENKLKSNKNFKNLLKNSENILTPVDLALSTLGSRDEINLTDFPVYQTIHDLGEKTIDNYSNIIKKAEVIFLKGLPGNYKEEYFDSGTETLLKTIESTKAEIFVVGEETLEALDYFNIDSKNFKFTSKNSESVFCFLNEEKFPALDIIKEKI